MSELFQIQDLHVEVEGKEVLHGVNLQIRAGEVHAIMGKNGSGKTTLSNTIMGHPKYKVTRGDVLLQGESLLGLSPDERAKKRLFLAFQYPVAVPGVSVAQFLRSSILAVRAGEVEAKNVRRLIREEASRLSIPDSFLTRSLNEGFSGGEKKRLETLQMRLLQPRMLVLDETDSGLDIDSLRQVSESVDSLRGPGRGLLLITHYQRMLSYVKPDFVHVFIGGRVVKTGGPELALQLEERGYDWVTP
ncbi:MAG: Fe-S cluster assembly ATPase SufC [Bdellovibrionales bacterium]|nr:Fe-S cluster assembly ATPase SufC [Bdellovibrionales bacterium]